jgi:ribosome-binding factor A
MRPFIAPMSLNFPVFWEDTNHSRQVAGNRTQASFSGILRSFIRGTGLEKRGQKYHRERLGEALREEIETILEGELGDPRIGLANVSQVQLVAGARSALVFVVVEGDDEEAETTMEGLQAAGGFIRRELVERLHLRRAPDLIFQLDRSREYQSRIDELLKRTKKR